MGFFDFLFSKKPGSSPKQKHASNEAKEGEHTKNDSQITSTARPAKDWQLKRAAELGIDVIAVMTYAEIQRAIDEAEFNKPPTHQQLKKARLLGVNVPPDSTLTYGQLALRLEEAALKQPARNEQVSICKRAGIEIPANMTVELADKLIAEAKADPKFREKFEEIKEEEQNELMAEEDRDLRERYGEKLAEDYRRWESISEDSGSHYVLIYRRGKEIAVEAVEFDGFPEIIEGKSPIIKIVVLLPKKVTHEKDWFSLQWEKEAEVKSSSVLHVQKLERPISDCSVTLGQESTDYVAYKKVIEKATAYSKKFETQ